MRLLIIGASGFLGSHIRRSALASGMEVVTAGRSDLAGGPGHRGLNLAEDEPATIAATIAGVAPDVVVNCAGATAGGPDVLSAVNVTGVYALAVAMLAAAAPIRLVHLGSAAEYGPGEPGVAIDESARPRPANPYGATKLAGTRLVQLARTAGLDAVVLRVFNPVGAGAPQTSLPGRLAAELRRAGQQAAGDATDVRLGQLDGVRDFVDARDVADAVLAAVTAAELPRPVLNVGSGLGVPIRTLVDELVTISGCNVTVLEDAAGSARSAAASWQQADIEAARCDLGWKPRFSLAAALTDLWTETA
jgi:nucleoside-diphosphate-sugar epimerase